VTRLLATMILGAAFVAAGAATAQAADVLQQFGAGTHRRCWLP
jgi:hypothetical protein